MQTDLLVGVDAVRCSGGPGVLRRGFAHDTTSLDEGSAISPYAAGARAESHWSRRAAGAQSVKGRDSRQKFQTAKSKSLPVWKLSRELMCHSSSLAFYLPVAVMPVSTEPALWRSHSPISGEQRQARRTECAG